MYQQRVKGKNEFKLLLKNDQKKKNNEKRIQVSGKVGTQLYSFFLFCTWLNFHCLL